MVTPYWEDKEAGLSIYCGDCREIMPTLAGLVNLLVTDPPYGTGGWQRTAPGLGRRPHGTLASESWDDGAVDWLDILPLRSAMIFFPAGRAHLLLGEAQRSGLTKHRAVYMHKRDPAPLPGGRFSWSIEPIWLLSREDYAFAVGDDLFSTSAIKRRRNREAVGNPYQKPLEVMSWLLQKARSGPVLDPFMGSGTTLVAAKLLGRRATGIEISEEYCDLAVRRLSQEVLPFHAAPVAKAVKMEQVGFEEPGPL